MIYAKNRVWNFLAYHLMDIAGPVEHRLEIK